MMINYRDVARNVMAREKALYDGHAGRRRRRHQRGDRQAGAEADQGRLRGAAARHRRGRGDAARRAAAARGHVSRPASSRRRRSPPTSPSASSSCWATSAAGFKQADIVDRARVQHQAGAPGLHRAARLPRQRRPRTARPSSGCAPRATSIVRSALRAAARHGRLASCASPPSEIGGGFGGKTVVYLEPVALALSRKAGRPVKMVMTREEVFRATGPTSGATCARQDRRQEGRPHRRRRGRAQVPGRRLRRLAGRSPAPCARSPATTSRTCKVDRLRRRDQPAEGRRLSRARRRRSSAFAVESVIDELAEQDRHGPDRVPPQERRQGGHARPSYGAEVRPDRHDRDARGRARRMPHYTAPLGQEPGPRHRLRLLVQHRRRDLRRRSTSTTTARVTLAVGTPDIGGSRASLCMMAAEELGIALRARSAPSSPTPARSATTSSPTAAAPPSPPAWRRSRPRATSSGKLCERAAKIWEHRRRTP